MHPIERLRYVARAGEGDPRMLVSETAGALRGLRLDPAGIVVACRRIVERHPTNGPLWWLCAQLLTSADPFERLYELADHVTSDPTPSTLCRELPDDATVVVVGWPDLVAEALVRRGDLRVLVVDAYGEGAGLVRRLEHAELDVALVSPEAAGAAAGCADVVLLEATAVGPELLLARTASRSVAAIGYCDETPVWAVAGRARRLPEVLWDGMLRRLDDADDPWEHAVEVVPLATVSHVCGPSGVAPLASADLAPECPAAPELLRSSAM